jgi:hypothetical protein
MEAAIMGKKTKISAHKPRVRNDGPTVLLLSKVQALIGGDIKVSGAGVLRLSKSAEGPHPEAAAGSPLAYYHYVRAITEAQRQAGEKYAALQFTLYGRELKTPSIYDRMVPDEDPVDRKFRPVGLPCGTYCGDACDCPARDWMENARIYAEADNHLRKTCRPLTRLVVRRVCFDGWWPESWAQVVRLRYGLGRLVVHWRY